MNAQRKSLLTLAVVLIAIGAGFWQWNARTAPAPDAQTESRQDEADGAASYLSELPRVPVTDDGNATAEATAQPQPAAPAQETNASQVRGNATPSEQRTDAVVTPDFIRDLARLCATNYHPPRTRHNPSGSGLTTLTFKKLNMHYGIELTGLRTGSRDVLEGRTAVLRHLMSPIVLRTVYALFGDAFVAALAEEGMHQTREFKAPEGGYAFRALTAKEAENMLDVYAAMVREVGSTFRAFAKRRDLVDVMERYSRAARRVTDAYGAYADLEAQDAPAKQLDRISAEIKKALVERDSMRATILSMASPKKTRKLLSEGDVMDIATWISRRLTTDKEYINAIGAIASLSEELAMDLKGFDTTALAANAASSPAPDAASATAQ
ncbi:hypothetical protein JCM16814_23620 [Desulfobaculum senezii]